MFGVLSFILPKYRRSGAIGVMITLAGFTMGGYTIEVNPVEPMEMSLGLDWLLLTLLGLVVIFTFMEKIIPKCHGQAILRPEWQLDLVYFTVNHLLLAILLLISNYFVATVFGWALSDVVQGYIQSLPTLVQIGILILCVNFVLYWSHRTFHEIPSLWKIHAVHHVVENMDWLAGSRNHIVQTIVDRCLAMAPLYLLGADKAALDMYVTLAAFQAVLVHSNAGIHFGPIKYIFVTPQYHHWHHSTDKPAIDTNYAVHFSLYDWLFGTYHMPDPHWPEKYGTSKRLPRTFIKQLLYPFSKSD